MNKGPIIKEVLVNAPIEKVWNAITQPVCMKIWYFDVPEFKTEAGFAFTFYAEKDDRMHPIACKITEVEQGRKLVYTWNYTDFPSETLVTFELKSQENATHVRFTHAGLENVPEKYRKDVSREMHDAAWESIICDSLKYFVERRYEFQ